MQQQLKNYALLMRIHKPIGTMLLLWPTLWALWLASAGQPNWQLITIFVLGTFLMRAAGCIASDMADRHIDGKVKRTKERPLVIGTVSLREAAYLATCLIMLSFFLTLLLNKLTIMLAVVALLLTLIYPFMKRYISIPQAVLGLAFAWGIPMAFAAVQGQVPMVAWLLFAATALWIIAYDTQYAMVDRDDDILIGVKSSAILFAGSDRLMIALLQLSALVLFSIVGWLYSLPNIYFVGIGVGALLFVFQAYLIRTRERAECFAAFNNNQYFGLVMFIVIIFTKQ